MSKSEYEVLKKLIEEKRKQIKNNQTEARSVLVRAGIFTKNGTLKKVYKEYVLHKFRFNTWFSRL